MRKQKEETVRKQKDRKSSFRKKTAVGKSASGEGYLIIGKNTVREVLRTSTKRVLTLWARKGSAEIRELVESSDLSRSRIQWVELDELDYLTGSDSHQGLAAEVTPLNLDVKSFAADTTTPCLILAAAGITDPHNLGAIFRVSECFGAEGVLYSRSSGCAITPAVTKVAVGATELVPSLEVSNMSRTLDLFKEHGFWVVGTALHADSVKLPKFEFPPRTIIVLGSEGKGLGALLSKQCDFTIEIPMYGQVDSLNVSQAAAICAYAYRCQFNPGFNPGHP